MTTDATCGNCEVTTLHDVVSASETMTNGSAFAYGEIVDSAAVPDEAGGVAEFVVKSLDMKLTGSTPDPDPISSFRNCGYDHSKSVATRSTSLRANEHAFVRSYSDRVLEYDLTLDKLSESEKKKLFSSLIKFQNDGTVEVDVSQRSDVTSELLQLDGVVSAPAFSEDAEFGFKSVPKLKIALLVIGTRGDVQPFLAFAKRLQEYGHTVRLATHANFRTFVKSAGVDFYPLGGDPRIMASYMVKNKGFLLSGPSEISVQRKQLKEIINSLLPACTEPDLDSGEPFRAQAIIANPPAYGHVHVAEALGVPLHIYFTFPWTPTNEFPHPFIRMPQTAGYRISYLIVDLIVWLGIRGFINDFRKKLKLPPFAYYSTYIGSISHLPTGYMWSPRLLPKPSDWGPLVDVVGFCFLNLGTKYQPSEEFVKWLEQGSKPIYIGFGSMPLEDEKMTTCAVLDALRETGQRGILCRGWGDLGSFSDIPVDVYLIDDCPHDWLFPRCAAVIHHGGAGTTATGLRAGCPTTVVPFFGDQFFWGERVCAKGVGPAPIPIAELTAERLANAITFMLDPEVKSKALELAREIENEDGVAGCVDAFHRHLPRQLPIPPPVAEPTPEEAPTLLEWIAQMFEKCCCSPA